MQGRLCRMLHVPHVSGGLAASRLRSEESLSRLTWPQKARKDAEALSRFSRFFGYFVIQN